MLFLKFMNLFAKNVPDVQSVIPDIAIPPDAPERYEPTLSIKSNSTTKNLLLVSTKYLSKKQKGNMYENYVAKLYRAKGYTVQPYGQLRGRWDGGRDLICKHRCYTIIVQCKYREHNSGASIDITDVYELFGAIKHY